MQRSLSRPSPPPQHHRCRERRPPSAVELPGARGDHAAAQHRVPSRRIVLQAYAQDVVFAIPQQRDEQQKPKPAPLSWKLTASELAYISSWRMGTSRRPRMQRLPTQWTGWRRPRRPRPRPRYVTLRMRRSDEFLSRVTSCARVAHSRKNCNDYRRKSTMRQKIRQRTLVNARTFNALHLVL
jgi:hypothetical protein